MVKAKIISIEVAYAAPQQQKTITLEVVAGSSIAEVIQQSGILPMFPEIDLAHQPVGIFSELKRLTDVVNAGDRIEIYRELLLDPKEARRKRAVAAITE